MCSIMSLFENLYRNIGIYFHKDKRKKQRSQKGTAAAVPCVAQVHMLQVKFILHKLLKYFFHHHQEQ